MSLISRKSSEIRDENLNNFYCFSSVQINNDVILKIIGYLDSIKDICNFELVARPAFLTTTPFWEKKVRALGIGIDWALPENAVVSKIQYVCGTVFGRFLKTMSSSFPFSNIKKEMDFKTLQNFAKLTSSSPVLHAFFTCLIETYYKPLQAVIAAFSRLLTYLVNMGESEGTRLLSDVVQVILRKHLALRDWEGKEIFDDLMTLPNKALTALTATYLFYKENDLEREVVNLAIEVAQTQQNYGPLEALLESRPIKTLRYLSSNHTVLPPVLFYAARTYFNPAQVPSLKGGFGGTVSCIIDQAICAYGDSPPSDLLMLGIEIKLILGDLRTVKLLLSRLIHRCDKEIPFHLLEKVAPICMKLNFPQISEILYEKILLKKPLEDWQQEDLMVVKMQLGKWEEADRIYNSIKQFRDKDLSHLNAGIVNLMLKRANEAESHLNLISEANHRNHPFILSLRAMAAQMSGQMQKAKKFFNQALKRYSKVPYSIFIGAAGVKFSLKRYRAAESHFLAAYETASDSTQTATLSDKLDICPSVLGHLERLLITSAGGGDNVLGLCSASLGRICDRLHHFPKADACYTQAIEAYQDHEIPFAVLANAGVAKVKVGRHRQANALFDRALKKEEGNISIKFLKFAAQTKKKLGLHQEAESLLTTAMIVDFKAKHKSKCWKEADALFEQIWKKRGETTPLTLLRLGVEVKCQLKLWEEANIFITVIKNKYGNDALLSFVKMVGMVKHQLGKVNEEIEVLSSAFKKKPGQFSAEKIEYLASLEASSRDWKSAYFLLNQAIEKYGILPSTFAYLALVELHLGYYEEADAHFKKIIKNTDISLSSYIWIGAALVKKKFKEAVWENSYLHRAWFAIQNHKQDLGYEHEKAFFGNLCGEKSLKEFITDALQNLSTFKE